MKLSLFWFRRDLRLNDNTGLYHALKSGNPVLPIFIFDTDILDILPSPKDARVEFIYKALTEIDNELAGLGSRILILYGKPIEIYRAFASELNVDSVYTNSDYEPEAIRRDNDVAALLKDKGIEFHSFKDQVIFEKDEVLKPDGRPYSVYTPYNRTWKAKLSQTTIQSYTLTDALKSKFVKNEHFPSIPDSVKQVHSLTDTGFEVSGIAFPSKEIRRNIIKKYYDTRDLPYVDGTTRLSVHLRFGTISIRTLVKEALKLNEKWLDELIWREFFMMILYHFPHVVNNSFKPAFENIKWRNDEMEFDAWCSGKTGYPMVDAGMRELNATGYMHNRVRMITASFLCKHLLIDWRWGESYFASKLLDYELSSNNGNWQWSAGSGCDAVPYFRVFNPELQARKFDPEGKYIKKWVPGFGTDIYPKPIVKHSFARERALECYSAALKSKY